MKFELEDMTDICVYPRYNSVEIEISSTGKNKVFIMEQLLETFGFELIFESLCENGLKELKSELEEKLKELEDEDKRIINE